MTLKAAGARPALRTLFLVGVVVGCGRDAAQAPPGPSAPAPTEAKPAVKLPVDVPAVTATGVPALPEPERGTITVVVKRDGLIVEGKAIVALTDGMVDPADLEGGALGVKIARLAVLIAAMPEASRVLLIADRQLPYVTLYQVLYTCSRDAGPKRFDIVVTTGATLGAIPIALPDLKSASSGMGGVRVGKAGEPPQEVRPVVTLTKDEVRLWSITQVEGSLTAPKLIAPLDAAMPAAITAALAEIVARRWPKGGRPDDDYTVIIMADPSTPLQTVATAMAAARTDAAGKELFPSIMLASAFQ